MKLCDDGCSAICDFCTYYVDEGMADGYGFAGCGTCSKHGSEVDAADMCEDFVCSSLIPRDYLTKGIDAR